MKQEIRRARPSDFADLLELWEEFGKEREALGSAIVVSEAYLEFIADVAAQVLFERIPGVAMIVTHRACCLWGPLLPYPTRFGRTMLAHGTYVRPRYRNRGLGPQMFEAAMEFLRGENLADAVLSSVDVGNERSERNAQAAGYVDVQMSKLVRV
jgi:GNAT superfamily N-acetyltransferase